MSLSFEKQSSLVAGIYDAALDSSRWAPVLEDITGFFHGSVGVLMDHDALSPANDIHQHVGNPEDIQSLYAEKYFLEGDIWYQIARRNWPSSRVLIGAEHITNQQLRKTGFYHEILEPADCGQQLSGSIRADRRFTQAIAISRPLGARSFDEADKRHMQDLVVHLEKAFNIHEKLCEVKRQTTLLEQILSLTNVAALLCTSTGKVLYNNERAEQIFERRDGLSSQKNLLSCKHPGDTERLSVFFRHILEFGSSSLALSARDDCNQYQLLGFVVDAERNGFAQDEKLVGVFIENTAEVLIPQASLLQSLYRVTVAEAEIIQKLFSGLTVESIAESKGVKISTVRTQLHRIFEKTDTRNQAQLVGLVAQGIARFRMPAVP